jgi:hypothetical protein
LNTGRCKGDANNRSQKPTNPFIMVEWLSVHTMLRPRKEFLII